MKLQALIVGDESTHRTIPVDDGELIFSYPAEQHTPEEGRGGESLTPCFSLMVRVRGKEVTLHEHVCSICAKKPWYELAITDFNLPFEKVQRPVASAGKTEGIEKAIQALLTRQ